MGIMKKTRQSKQCGFSIYIFDNSKSKSMVKSEKMALSGLVFARKIARMILIQNIYGLIGPREGTASVYAWIPSLCDASFGAPGLGAICA